MNENFVKEKLLSLMTFEKTDKTVEAKVPAFFAVTGDDLHLTFCYSDEIFYVHDNGGAVAQLRQRVKNEEELTDILKIIGTNLSFDGNKTVGAFCQAHTFFRYAQMLVFVANADLYYKVLDDDGLTFDSDIVLPDHPQKIDPNGLKGIFENGVYFSVNNDGSYRITPQMFYSTFSTFASYQIELTETDVKISDFRKGNIEGELFEAFYWDHDDITKYGDELQPYLNRFNADFDGKDVFVSDSAENVVEAIMRFFSLSVLLSEFGGLIQLPKGR